MPVTRFVLHWGDLGGQWGVNRSVAQIHALLYLSEQPQTAEAIADKLGMARSNVSNSIKELLIWGRTPTACLCSAIAATISPPRPDIWEIVTRIAPPARQRSRSVKLRLHLVTY